MYSSLLLLGGAALASAQVAYLTATESGVLPVLPTPFPSGGIETNEGAIVYDGPEVPGFTGPGGNATIQSNNPSATYQAVLPVSSNFDNATGSLITGSITGVANGGSGVAFTVNFTGFPLETEYGPFVYHVHNFPVPADGNCTATIGHLDPTDRGEYHPCENTAPQTCQAGDLAGKHGNITTTSFTASYTELYLSTDPSSPYFFGDKSVVIHSTNTSRLTCANFVLVSPTNSTASNTTTPTISATSAPATFTGAAGHLSFSTGAVGVVAAMLLSYLL